jgi:mannosyltransferase
MPGNVLSPDAAVGDQQDGAAERPPWHRRPGWVVIAVPMVAALALGGYRLGGPSLWRDEAYTISVAGRSPGQIAGLLAHLDAVHGPYYLCMHFVVSLLGTSAVAIRLPSLLATSVAAGFTAAIGRRLARTAALPAPSVTGLLAGLLFVAAPRTTYYAQDARPYGLVVMFAAAATYLLIRAAADDRWRWWVAYGAAITMVGVFNLFALLLVVAHGAALTQARLQARAGRPALGSGQAVPSGPAGQPGIRLPRWAAAVAVAVIPLTPMFYFGYQQGSTLGWVKRPGLPAVIRLVTDMAGSQPLIPLVAVLAVAGAAAGLRSRQPGQPSLTAVALPWLVLPAFILLGISQVHPAYVERYVVFSLPALALLCAAGLAGLAGLAARSPIARQRAALAWLPSAVILAVLAGLLVRPQHLTGPPAARPDNLRAAAAAIGANARPGDVVFFIPSKTRIVRIAYPAQFTGVRDLALAKSPAASATLVGTQVHPPALRSLFAGVRRVWVVQWKRQLHRRAKRPVGRAELALIAPMHLVRRWHARSIVVSLYAMSGAAG